MLKVLQRAGIKLDGVASDAFGKSGMAILRALAEGKATLNAMANLAKGLLRKKLYALEIALENPRRGDERGVVAEILIECGLDPV